MASDASLRFQDVVKTFGGTRAVKGVSFVVARRRDRGAARRERRRQVDADQDPRRHLPGGRGRDPARRRALRARRLGGGQAADLLHPPGPRAGRVDDGGRERRARPGLSPPQRAPRDRLARDGARGARRRWRWSTATSTPTRACSRCRRTEKSLVAIARALATECDFLVLDEPTASLPANEVERLFAVMRSLKARGVGMIYVSHRLDEIFRVADRVVVLRDGDAGRRRADRRDERPRRSCGRSSGARPSTPSPRSSGLRRTCGSRCAGLSTASRRAGRLRAARQRAARARRAARRRAGGDRAGAVRGRRRTTGRVLLDGARARADLGPCGARLRGSG